MFGAVILETAIGLIFLYLLFSLVCSAANELIAQVFNLRAKNLEKGIKRILTDHSVRQRLWHNPELRQEITAAADHYMAEANLKAVSEKPEDLAKALEQLREQLDKVEKMPPPLGWSEKAQPKGGYQWIKKILGLFITALASSMGAPFWFYLLNKIKRLRVSGQVPKKASEIT